jgi:hypothetical protein
VHDEPTKLLHILNREDAISCRHAPSIKQLTTRFRIEIRLVENKPDELALARLLLELLAIPDRLDRRVQLGSAA